MDGVTVVMNARLGEQVRRNCHGGDLSMWSLGVENNLMALNQTMNLSQRRAERKQKVVGLIL